MPQIHGEGIHVAVTLLKSMGRCSEWLYAFQDVPYSFVTFRVVYLEEYTRNIHRTVHHILACHILTFRMSYAVSRLGDAVQSIPDVTI